MSSANPFVAALRGRCPRCGEGQLFTGYLRLAPYCPVCHEDFRHADSGDGPAVFVMFAVGAVVVPIAFILEFAAHWPPWAIVGVVAVMTVALSLALLQPFKAMLFALQWKHAAGEAQRVDQGRPDDEA
ncbi:MAG: DUF983 domain-containing protein [Alphaproteobacteria bacterium]|nr:DUF983 domain-containing protein [Alphaproteobacteria bacterium]